MFLIPQQEFLFVHDPHDAIGLDKLAILVRFRVRRECYHEESRLAFVPRDLVAVFVNRHDIELFFFKRFGRILDGIGIARIQNRVTVRHRNLLALIIADFAIRDAVGIHGNFGLGKLFLQDVTVIREKLVAFHKRDDHLAESLFGNHD